MSFEMWSSEYNCIMLKNISIRNVFELYTIMLLYQFIFELVMILGDV